MKVIVIGGGPAGMMAAIASKQMGNEVEIFEKMNSCGRKLLITGKGRCNITSSLDIKDFISNVPGNGKFLYSSFQNYTNEDIINFLKEQNVYVKEERGNRIFPCSDKSIDVLNAFKSKLKELNIKVNINSKVESIEVEKEQNNINKKLSKVIGIKLENGNFVKADKVILATGGKSYCATGSTGDGYEMVKRLGHTVTPIEPSLVPLAANSNNNIDIIKNTKYKNSLALCKEVQGLSLKNVKIQFKDIEKNKIIYEDFGEMIFTHFGVSGPTILSASAHLLRYKNIHMLLKEGKIILQIDLKPALSEEKLNNRILRDLEKFKNKEVKNSFNELLPQKLIMPIINLLNLSEGKQANSITKEERQFIVKLLKGIQITIQDFRGINDAIITAGGISIKEINPKTMESKLVDGLYFAGEVIDVDAYTGGFNLQIAYSTGYTAGISDY